MENLIRKTVYIVKSSFAFDLFVSQILELISRTKMEEEESSFTYYDSFSVFVAF